MPLGRNIREQGGEASRVMSIDHRIGFGGAPEIDILTIVIEKNRTEAQRVYLGENPERRLFSISIRTHNDIV
ncbi:hypothetical protein ACWDXV_30385 [Nocardia nova]